MSKLRLNSALEGAVKTILSNKKVSAGIKIVAEKDAAVLSQLARTSKIHKTPHSIAELSDSISSAIKEARMARKNTVTVIQKSLPKALIESIRLSLPLS